MMAIFRWLMTVWIIENCVMFAAAGETPSSGLDCGTSPCVEDVNECSLNSSLCLNGASCVNTVGSYLCQCAPGYTGEVCASEIDECASSPCYFGGTCINLINNFRCQCLPEFEGPQCQGVIRQCQIQSPCGDDGICVDKPLGGYKCFCKPGYYGDHCEFEVNLCVTMPCVNGATCVNYAINYSCICTPGYTGAHCETDINECSSNPCLNNGSCSEGQPNTFSCQCVPGFVGPLCQTNFNECQSNPCRGRQVCVDLLNDYRCECPPGTTGEICETDIFDCRVAPACLNNGTCLSIEGAYICQCPVPFTGQNCGTSLDPCTPSPCLFGGTCYRVNASSYGCACVQGYVGTRCEADVYDCLVNPCQNGGTCVDLSFLGEVASVNRSSVNTEEALRNLKCTCPAKFTGTLCEQELTACMSSPCHNGGTCSSQGILDYSCVCLQGWTGPNCGQDINECLAVPSVCVNNGQCINRSPGYFCVCPVYWTGTRCDTDIVECNTNSCMNGGTCLEGIGRPSSCICTAGFTGNNCSAKLSSCDPNPCQNNATCTDETDDMNFTCNCLPGYTGLLCETNVDECTILKPCHNNATCVDGINSYRCQCQVGWTGETCQENIDDCLSNPCHNGATCLDFIGYFQCQCPVGYTNPTCNYNIDECIFQPCRNNGTCLDVTNGFVCQCLPGYTGVACESDINECLSAPCANGSTCLDNINNFTCVCLPGLTGFLCTEDIQECSPSPCQNAGTCLEPQLAMYSCSCPAGVAGTNCEIIKTATFDGSDFLTFTSLTDKFIKNINQVLSSAGAVITIQFTFTTTVLDGVILVLTGNSKAYLPQHLILELHSSILYISASNGEQLERDSIVLPDQPSTIQSHTVLITMADHYCQLTLDSNMCSTSSSCERQMEFVNSTAWDFDDVFYFGGVQTITPYIRNVLLQSSYFIGCLGNLIINSRAVNLAEGLQYIDSIPVPSTSPVIGCADHVPCLNSTCKNGGKCLDMWTHQSCSCVPGFTGPTCALQNLANFHKENMLYFDERGVISQLSLEFNAANGSGLLLYTLTSDLFSLSLDNGQIHLQLVPQTTGRDRVLKLGSNLQGWITVSLQFVGQLYTLHASSPSGPLGPATGTASSQIVATGPIYLGTLHAAFDQWRNRDPPLPSELSISGCIRNVTINNNFLDLSKNVATPLGNDPPPARAGCEVEEACLSKTCLNQGVCSLSWTSPTCQCAIGYTGENCSQALSASFNGVSSYSFVQLDRSLFSFGDSGMLEFRTRQATSNLLLLQFLNSTGAVGNFIEIRNSNNKVQIYSSFSKDLVESNIEISDGVWHTLSWRREKSVFVVSLDGNNMFLDAQFNPSDASLNSTMYIYIGARPENPGNASTLVGYFKGCMGKISFNTQPLLYAVDGISPGAVVSATNTLVGCTGDHVCLINPCPANSYCVDQWNSFECPCLAGWEGSNCSISSDDCVNNSCQNGGLCIDQHLSYSCQCSDNFTGQFCETPVQACNQSRCVTNQTSSCVSLSARDFFCNCLPGYTGRFCEQQFNNCSSFPCLNNGTCVDSVNNYTCRCMNGYSGQQCEFKDYCIPQPCFNGGTCFSKTTFSNVTSNTSLTNLEMFTCVCVNEYFGLQCQSYNYCMHNECLNNGSCLLEIDKFTCNCSIGYYGVYCQFVDYCASSPCLHSGQCRNTQDSFVCLCPSLYSGTTCEVPVNQCTTNTCFNGGTCMLDSTPASSNSSSCLCPVNYTGKQCQTFVNPCQSQPCANNGTCSLTVLGLTCTCGPGFTGTWCQADIDECSTQPCQNGGSCLNKINSYACSCTAGFTGHICEVDMRGCTSNPCLNNAQCMGSGSNFTCLCLPGYTGMFCGENINDCSSNPCKNGGRCIDGVDSYKCLCSPGYTSTDCTELTDSCYSQPCFNQGVCTYRGLCSCPDVNSPCEWFNQTCQTQRCIQRENCSVLSPSYFCNCTGTGYTGLQCADDLDECQQNPCQHDGTCQNSVGSFSCNCARTGYHGSLCQTDDDECQGQNKCYNGGTCVNTAGSYSCQCPAAWTGAECGQNKDDCQLKPCSNAGVCTDLVGGYSCDCTGTGFTGVNCTENIDDCVNNRCVNGRCVDGVRQYTCVCDGTGYTGQFCQTDVDECSNQTHGCHLASQCVNTPGGYYCHCGNDSTGQYCETSLPQTATTSDLSEGGLAAIVILIIAIIILIILLTVWQLKRRKKTHGIYKPAEVEGQVRNGSIALNKFSDRRELLI